MEIARSQALAMGGDRKRGLGRRLLGRRLFGPDLQHYLDCVVKGVEFWIRTGRVVEKDQFGRNRLYSG